LKRKTPPFDPQSFRKILIVQTAFLGDVILTTPLLPALKVLFPEAQLHFVSTPAAQNILQNNSHLSRVWIYDKRGVQRGMSGLWKMAGKLRASNFDVAIVPHRSIRSALLVLLAKIPLRIGFNKSAGSFLFNRQVVYRQSEHEIERNLRLLESLGYTFGKRVLPEIFPDRADRERVSNWLNETLKSPEYPFIALAPGSVWNTKRWPAAYWSELADQLDQLGFRVVLVGSKQDKFLSEEIRATAESELLNAMGEFTLRQSAELIRRAALLICNDSAPTHIGVAVRTPVLTIFGPTVPAFGFYPYGEKDRVAELSGLTCRPCSIHGGARCPLGHFDCMLKLSPETVFRIAREMLNENPEN